MSSSKTITDLSRQEWIDGHSGLIYELPDGEFLRRDLPEPIREYVDPLRFREIIHRVDTQMREGKEGSRHSYRIAVFEVADDAADRAQQLRDERDAICPCGHSGVANRGDHFECRCVACFREFSRDELEVEQ